MKKKKLIIMIGCIILLCSTLIVSAAFIFSRSIDGDAESGKITIIKEGYISYALNQDVDSSNFLPVQYKAILKERAGVSKVDGIKEIPTSDISSYYIKNETNNISSDSEYEFFTLDEFGNYIHFNKTSDSITEEKESNNDSQNKYYYFIEATSFDSSTEYYRLGHKLVSMNDKSANDIDRYYILSSVDSMGYGVFSKASSPYNEKENYFVLVYEPKDITADGTIISGENAGLSCVNTYATERNLNQLEKNYIYLNQLGFKFSIQTNVNAYLRVKFFDAWISSKLYPGASNLKENYIKKDQVGDKTSPFKVTADNWYYDQINNCCYMTIPIKASSDTHEYTFNINESYFSKTAASVYKENIYVQVSYSLELIQANRASTVWEIDPSTLGGNN